MAETSTRLPERDALEPDKAWLLLAAGDNREHGGNDGYLDEPDAHYSWDSTVLNHAHVSPGDYIALWDKDRLLGISVVEGIQTDEDDKLVRRCTYCRKAHIKARKTKNPKFKCFDCGSEFQDPLVETQHVVTYRSVHAAGWSPLEGLLSGAELRVLCHSPKSQLSIRSLNWPRFAQALADRGVSSLQRWNARATPMSGGHRLVTVRARIGQGKFRDGLISAFGPLCAITGATPTSALEAAHLYSYADIGVHHSHGGLLLRRDIHRLFDDGEIAVNPETSLIDVSDRLAKFDQYRRLHGLPLAVSLSPMHLSWISAHWQSNRGGG